MHKRKSLLLAASLILLFTSVAVAQQRPRRRPPPREAVDACQGKAAGDACAFRFRDRDIKGKCLQLPRAKNRPLVCVPDWMRKRLPPARP